MRMSRTKHTPARLAIGCCALSLLLVATVDLGADRALKEQTFQAVTGALGTTAKGSGKPADGGTACEAPTAQLVCLAKQNARLESARVRARVVPLDRGHTMLCLATRSRSMSGFLDVYFDDQVHHASAVSDDLAGLKPFSDDPLPGDNWDWCRPGSS